VRHGSQRCCDGLAVQCDVNVLTFQANDPPVLLVSHQAQFIQLVSLESVLFQLLVQLLEFGSVSDDSFLMIVRIDAIGAVRKQL